VVGTVSDEGSVLGRGKVSQRRVYTIPSLNRLGRGGNSSKQGRILISDNDSTYVERNIDSKKKNNITGYTTFVRTRIIANITFVRNTITHKDTFNRLSRKFMKFTRR
jgi:hypothetical protein